MNQVSAMLKAINIKIDYNNEEIRKAVEVEDYYRAAKYKLCQEQLIELMKTFKKLV